MRNLLRGAAGGSSLPQHMRCEVLLPDDTDELMMVVDDEQAAESQRAKHADDVLKRRLTLRHGCRGVEVGPQVEGDVTLACNVCNVCNACNVCTASRGRRHAGL